MIFDITGQKIFCTSMIDAVWDTSILSGPCLGPAVNLRKHPNEEEWGKTFILLVRLDHYSKQNEQEIPEHHTNEKDCHTFGKT